MTMSVWLFYISHITCPFLLHIHPLHTQHFTVLLGAPEVDSEKDVIRDFKRLVVSKTLSYTQWSQN